MVYPAGAIDGSQRTDWAQLHGRLELLQPSRSPNDQLIDGPRCAVEGGVTLPADIMHALESGLSTAPAQEHRGSGFNHARQAGAVSGRTFLSSWCSCPYSIFPPVLAPTLIFTLCTSTATSCFTNDPSHVAYAASRHRLSNGVFRLTVYAPSARTATLTRIIAGSPQRTTTRNSAA